MAYIINQQEQGYSRTDFLSALVTKQDTLSSGTNIKTVNGLSVLGDGNIVIQTEPSVVLSLETAKTFMAKNLTRIIVQGSYKWAYQAGLLLMAMLRVHDAYDVADENKIVEYAQKYYHDMINANTGAVTGYVKGNMNLDHIQPGYNLFYLRNIGDTYSTAYNVVISTFYDQLANVQEHINTGNSHPPYWHKVGYPHQAWLDGLFMCEPFRALYALNELSGAAQASELDDIAGQLIELGTLTYDGNTQDGHTGLYRHAFAEAGSAANGTSVIGWADSEGKAYFTWGRGLGWYILAIEEVLDVLPNNHSMRGNLIGILRGICTALKGYVQDQDTYVWRRLPAESADLSAVVNGVTKTNEIEASASCMYAYGYLHGVRMGYLDNTDRSFAKKAYEDVVENFVTYDNNGGIVITHCEPAGNPGGDKATTKQGVLENYFKNDLTTDDLHSIGPFILASLEYELFFSSVE